MDKPLTIRQIKKMSPQELQDYLYNFTHLYITENHTREEVMEDLNISIATFRSICKTYGIVKGRDGVGQTTKRTKLKRYGNENYNNRDLSKQTNSQRYGVSNPSQAEQVKDKRKDTNQQRYGGVAPACSDEVKAKMQATCLERYGVSNVFNSPQYQDRACIAKAQKYGNPHFNNRSQISQTWLSKSPQLMEKIKQKRIATNLQRFGTSNAFGNRDIQAKIQQTCMKKYGVPYFCMSEQCQQAQGHIISKINLKFAQLLDSFNIDYQMGFKLDKYSYDFKIGKYLVEINPTYTHNSTIGFYANKQHLPPKDSHYHLQKSKMAEDNGYFCIHVWDWDDWEKVIYRFLPKTTIYARKCEIKEVDEVTTHQFLNQYHLQDSCRGQKYRFGLFYNNQLIQIITFGAPRYNKHYQYELLRLCTDKDYSVVGGAQKLFKYFVDRYSDSIISYCDCCKFHGDVYGNLGMTLLNKSTPSKIWFDGQIMITDNLLRQRGFDQLFNTNFGKQYSNEQLMIEYGFVVIYNCGQYTFVCNKQN